MANSELILTPKEYAYSLEDFKTETPYAELYKLFSNRYIYLMELDKVNENAVNVGFKGFKSKMREYTKIAYEEMRHNRQIMPNQTEFDGQDVELNCGQWESTDWGIFRDTPNGGRETACSHPIMPVSRLVNIDTGEVKLTLAYKPPGRDKKWRTTIVDKTTISTARNITALATQGISVTSSTASVLVDYLNDIENLNYDQIPEQKSIGRLGYITGEGFSPYVDGLVFDGDASYRNLYDCVRSKGSVSAWYDTALECRKMSVTARILLAASFASPLLSIIGSLPFFVHLWGVDSGTGKTVALMLAASVWGNPAVGSYTQTFNGTQVGQERTAAFLNHLPMCLDELQLTKNAKGQSNFDVYQLAQGVGRARGKKNGGVEMVPTWSCCFLTTGESPLTSVSSGAGAVNRVIDIECTAGSAVIAEGHRIAGVLKNNYGFAGQIFVNKIYENEDNIPLIREIYQDFFRNLCAGDSTEKQAMAAAAILTADLLATNWIFKDDQMLTVEDIQNFLASREAVSAGRRAYDWLCDWVSANSHRFYTDGIVPINDAYGIIDGNTAYINRGVFNRAIQEAGFSGSATLSYLKSNKLIDATGRKYTKCKRINGVRTECVAMKLPADAPEFDDFDDMPL